MLPHLALIGVVGLDVPDVVFGEPEGQRTSVYYFPLFPVSYLSIAASMAFMPPGFLIGSVEKLVWAPAPFQSPWIHFYHFHDFLEAEHYLHGLGIETDNHAKVLRDPDEEVAGEPEVIPHVNAEGGPHLRSTVDS